MATPISNTVKNYAPFVGKALGLIVPPLGAAMGVSRATSLLSTKSPKVPSPTPAPQTLVGSTTQKVAPTTYTPPPAPAPSAPVNGLLQPDLTSLRRSLEGVQSGLSELQANQQQPFASQNPAIFPNIVSSLATRSVQPSEAFLKSQEEYSKKSKELADYKTKLAETLALQEGQGIPLQFVQGRQQAIQRQAEAGIAAREEALGRAATQQQVALEQQGLEQRALTEAAGLIPDALRYGFGGGNLTPQNVAASYAQQVRSGQLSPEQAQANMNSLYPGVGATFLNQALQGTGQFNYNVASAQAASQTSNVKQQQTAQVDIARQGLTDATQRYVEMTGAAQFAEQQSGAVKNILSKYGLNNVSSTDYNRALNNLRSRFSDPEFAQLSAALREAQLAYSNLLSTGGSTPTTNDQAALATLDINQSARVIEASIRQLDDAVARRLQAQNSVRTQFETNLGGANIGGIAPTTGNSTWSW